jgi:T3SS negative regulator,GrlR
MLEALWSVQFASNLNVAAAGVVVLETKRIFGGDSQYFYVGGYEYDVLNGQASATIKVTRYAGAPSSIFGPTKEFNLRLAGTPTHDAFELRGNVTEKPNLRIALRLTRRAELP